MKNTYSVLNKRITSQNEPIPGENQVENNAGGFVYQLDKFKQLERFLILGTEGGTYYVQERKLTLDNAKCVLACLKEGHKRTVDLIVDISDKGRAPKNDSALFALAVACSNGTESEKKYALDKLPKVARIGTHLFHFVNYLDGMRGWGRAVRKAVAKWYEIRDPEKVAFQLAKYQQRDGWSHKDILRLAHPKPVNEVVNNLFKWAVDKKYSENELIGLARALELAKKVTSEKDIISIINEFQAPFEIIPTEYRKSKEVWRALLPHLGLTAIVRNLGNMGAYGLLKQGEWDAIKMVTTLLSDKDEIKKSRIHPIQALSAMLIYKQGEGYKGSNEWEVVPQIADALNKLFYESFSNVESTGKRFYLAVDVSGSMSSGSIAGIEFISPAMGAAAMAMVIARSEPNYIIKGFSDELVNLPISPNMSLDQAMKVTSSVNYGRTDCAQPMIDALQNNIPVDVFVVITDNETWAGNIHPSQALKQYRDKTGINAKEIVIGMTATEFTIAGPDDPNALDVAGFDTSTPLIINEFAKM